MRMKETLREADHARRPARVRRVGIEDVIGVLVMLAMGRAPPDQRPLHSHAAADAEERRDGTAGGE